MHRPYPSQRRSGSTIPSPWRLLIADLGGSSGLFFFQAIEPFASRRLSLYWIED
jgi:hypothetical protein